MTGEKLKIISLGGLNEVGKNLTVYEYGNDILVADCGLGFPDGEMYGVDVVIPDVTYLVKNAHKIRGIVLTHGHEDHIGAIPYVLKDISAHPFSGIGKPEPLKGENGKWSRRINEKDRLVYSFEDDTVMIYQCRGHYHDH